MILQALNGYYHRMLDDPNSGMPPYGTSIENISFALVINQEGELQDVEDLRVVEGKKLRPRKMAVPAAEKKASGIKANFLWDSTSYVLGLDSKGNQDRTDKCLKSFIKCVNDNTNSTDLGFNALHMFFENKKWRDLLDRNDWKNICDTNLVFRLDGVAGFIHDRPAARLAWKNVLKHRDVELTGQCLLTGEKSMGLARLHPSIKGVLGSQSSGASIVSFNKGSFESYGKEQSYNSPVSNEAAFNYSTALNYILAHGSQQKITIGGTTIAFWAECASPAEDFFADLFDPPSVTDKKITSEDDQQTTQKIHSLLTAVRDGKRVEDIVPNLDESVQFYLLGLAPNAARLSIRFWETNSLGNLLKKIGRYFDDLSIVRQFDNEPEFPPMWRLLCQTATLGKSENISPVLAGGLARAMLTGTPYPQSLLATVLGRIRAEHDVTYFRAALLKAFLVRNNEQMEVSMSLDPQRKDSPYLLGRLFAVLEKAQEDAIPGTSATIKDRYIGSASATPGLVFHVLLKNSANHIAKLRKDTERTGQAIHYERMIQEIVDGFDIFPKTQTAEQQGLFMVGYYHQRKAFFTKKNQEV
ncbi:CRISPR-associated protein, Csd1 family [Desulfuromusa kysingii]|uniref:CRISPR-associated protein, Csd1 family n=1 Tax=Desulfuromusa kysingii TaxID=37625 RepID=A0A1H4CLL0_9BACT|nr:type I-C CRISPR-associated protein Cas8c/Csd1 [Desulfuromusa kysingii]SEA61219.1 CRISPR-associated protein, Csd1 family [Desulfuromusa kysingii]